MNHTQNQLKNFHQQEGTASDKISTGKQQLAKTNIRKDRNSTKRKKGFVSSISG